MNLEALLSRHTLAVGISLLSLMVMIMLLGSAIAKVTALVLVINIVVSIRMIYALGVQKGKENK